MLNKECVSISPQRDLCQATGRRSIKGDEFPLIGWLNNSSWHDGTILVIFHLDINDLYSTYSYIYILIGKIIFENFGGVCHKLW